MSALDQEFFLVRTVDSHHYEMGSGFYSVPKLYLKGSAKSLVTKRNKEADRIDDDTFMRTPDARDMSEIKRSERYEAVPVTITLKEPS